jgi:hypothetical protein
MHRRSKLSAMPHGAAIVRAEKDRDSSVAGNTTIVDPFHSGRLGMQACGAARTHAER